MRLICLFTGLLLWGCASSQVPLKEYDPSTGQVSFSSPKMRVGNVSMSSGLAGGQRLMMQVFAACEGEGCRPSEVQIAFFNDSSRDLNLDYRRIEMTFGGRTLNWEDVGRRHDGPRGEVPRGEFIRVPLSLADFELLAFAPNVNIAFGLTSTSTFRMASERREPLRELVQVMGIAPVES